MDYYVATSTCSGDTCTYQISSQIIGDVVFPLSILVFLQALIACGLLFGTFLRKR